MAIKIKKTLKSTEKVAKRDYSNVDLLKVDNSPILKDGEVIAKVHEHNHKWGINSDNVMQLEIAFKLGCTKEEACAHAGVTRMTLHNYCKAFPDFAEKVEEWRQFPVIIARKSVVEAMPLDADLAFKYLTRRKPEEFSEKITVDNKHSLDPAMFGNMSNAELSANLSLLLNAPENGK